MPLLCNHAFKPLPIVLVVSLVPARTSSTDSAKSDRVNSGDIAQDKLKQVLGGAIPQGHPFKAPVFDVGAPLLVIDHQKLDPVTEIPAHCTFALEEGPPRQLLGHATDYGL